MSDVIRVSIGTDPTQALPCAVLKSSILRRASRTVEFTESWSAEGGWHPLHIAGPPLKSGTSFSAWRWIVPEVYLNKGRAIYIDADQVVMADIAALFDWPLESRHMFGAVVGADGVVGSRGPAHDQSVQTSVMVMDCERCDWSYPELVAMVNQHRVPVIGDRSLDPHFAELKGRDDFRYNYGLAMQACWIPLESICRLGPEWNHFNTYTPESRLVHYTLSKEQCWKTGDDSTPERALWFRELRESIASGHVTRDDVATEVKAKHVNRKVLDFVG